MLRPFLICAFAYAAVPALADFTCPEGTTPLEKKDEAQWMKACQDAGHQLHGPFEVWSRPAGADAAQAYQRTTQGQYTHGRQTGTWVFWNIQGEKKAEQTFP
jgi:hypothetical protein